MIYCWRRGDFDRCVIVPEKSDRSRNMKVYARAVWAERNVIEKYLERLSGLLRKELRTRGSLLGTWSTGWWKMKGPDGNEAETARSD